MGCGISIPVESVEKGERRMNLLEDFARPCVLLEKKRTESPEGGWTTEWTEGAEFKNYMALDTSMEARRAEKEGVTSLYSALVDKYVPIEYNDYFRDLELGETFRVTSNPEEKQAPASASFQLKSFTAEKRALPS